MLQLNKEMPIHSIHVIGAGGTGGFYLETLSRVITDTTTVHIYDGDHVEDRNLLRQSFIESDIGHNKAESFAKRLEERLSPVEWVAHPNYLIDEEDYMADIMLTEAQLIISAVDNTATRQLINKAVEQLRDIHPLIVLDAGNTDKNGQVVVHTNYPVTHVDLLGNQTSVTLPSALELYPEMNHINGPDDENPGLSVSCVDVSEKKPQAMLANTRNADILAGITQLLLDQSDLPGNVWQSNLLTLETTNQMKGVII